MKEKDFLFKYLFYCGLRNFKMQFTFFADGLFQDLPSKLWSRSQLTKTLVFLKI